ncbi:ABC transporter G family member 15-like [Arachis stenosperma]|uniref:ABC transporter G family member 15-like n=1 Tax=Arachis stenosperma TaxID=217475 RepID=UPI0025AD6DAA|nr:ABC transporter G family member 15-like [Arachis stenosperma]
MAPTTMELHDGGAIMESDNNIREVCLVWEDLEVEVVSSYSSERRKKVLNGISGYAEPNRIMALIGPSGAGKSTFLDALAGRLGGNVRITGNVTLNGTKTITSCRNINYVTQEDYFLGTLTVRETLTYAAHLRLAANKSKDEIDKVVVKTLDEMGLKECAESRLGNWHSRGISKGEKRRLSIGIEILTQPHILLLDEPTSGLDSAAAFFVISSLTSIAHNGRIVLCSIHQLSSEVFNLFDDLVLLAAGETVYFGERTNAIKFFADAGFPCPTRKNPPEHFLRCVSPEFDNVLSLMRSKTVNDTPSSWNSLVNMTTEETKWNLINSFKNSMHSANVREKIREIKLRKEPVIDRAYDTSTLKQLCTLTHRSFLNMTRDIGYYWLRILFYILVSVCAGFLYLNVGTSNNAILPRSKCDGFIYGFMTFLCIGGMPFFLEELKVFEGERFGRRYGEAIYVLSSFMSSLPFVVAISLTSGTILYHMVNFHPGFSHYCYFCINLFCSISVTEGSMLVVAALVSNQLLAIVTAAGVTVLMLMPSNVSRRITDIPNFFWRYPMSYISYIAWSIEGQYKNDFVGLEFEPLIPGDRKIKGEVILKEILGIQTDYSKWWDVGVLVLLLISYRVLFYFALKHRERASSIFRTRMSE